MRNLFGQLPIFFIIASAYCDVHGFMVMVTDEMLNIVSVLALDTNELGEPHK